MHQSDVDQAIAQGSTAMLFLGVAIIVVGVGAFLAPLLATITVVTIFAWVYLVAGIIRIVQAFQSRHQRGFRLRLSLGILYEVVSLLIFVPVIGKTVSLTLALGLALMLEGVLEVILAVQLRPSPRWVWVMLSGILSVTLGVLVASGLTVGAVWLLGALVGASLVLTGLWFIMLSQAFHR